jgi:hypothetical protein
LFGHDLERGVVLRGRLRAIWLDQPSNAEGLAALNEAAYDAFCSEPPPLTT